MPQPPLLFGRTAAMARVLDQCLRYGPTRYPVLILGPSGTGKTMLARHIHGLSRRDGAFITCSMASVPPNLENATLRGHARGAFTDASSDRPGLIEDAHRGTLFLDELALASATTQEALLEALDENTVRRIGDSRRRPVDVRVIAATNADIEKLRDAGKFRRDLLSRFGYLWIRMPPLRDRRDEIIPLVQHYVADAARTIGLVRPPVLTERVRECLTMAPWNENVRELQSVCVFAVLHCGTAGEVQLSHLPPEFLKTLGASVTEEASRTPLTRARDVLAQTGGNKARAARLLGVSRRHFYRLLDD